jgi:precorrin-2 dehydrogenase/sirohydrochlorin ferrochelatase
MIAIATDGTSPSLAKKIRQELEQKYGMEYELLLEISQELRLRLQWEVDDPKLRYQLMKELVADHWVQVCRERPTTARAEMLAWLEEQIQVRGGKICERS